MKSSVDFLEGNRVKVSVEVEEDEFAEALDAAFRQIARDVRIPGFRPGKAPRRLIEARLGTEVARTEALRNSLPGYYEKAIAELDLRPIAAPEFEITAGQQSGPVAFDATVEIMPDVGVAGYDGLRVVLPNLDVREADVDKQVDKLREQHGQLRAVSRPARDGDHVSIDRKVTVHDQTLLAAEDELYEVGKGTIAEELDKELRGKRAGDILRFNAAVPEHGEAEAGTGGTREVTFTVLVKEVREKVLPEVTDEWASEASEFETAAELREDIRRRMDAVRRFEAALMMRDKILEALAELVEEDLPQALVAREAQRRADDLQHRLSHQGASIPAYLEATGMSEDQLVAGIEAESIAALKADLALQAVAEMESIEVTDEEVEAEIDRLAERRKEKPAALRRKLQDEGELPAVRSGLRKTKAMEWLVEHTEYVDEEGREIDRSELEFRPAGAAEDEGDEEESVEPADEQ